MRFIRDVLERLARVPRRTSEESELEEEFRFHLEMQTAKNVALGLSPEEARRAALISFGGRARYKEEVRDQNRRHRLEDLGQDLRYGVRFAIRAPLFSLLAVLTLALGIGANAAVFGVVKSVLLDALPYQEADRLVRVYGRPLDGSTELAPLSAGSVVDFTQRQRSFTRLAAFFNTTWELTYAAGSEPLVVKGAAVGTGFFETLGVQAAVGRKLTAADAATGAPPVVMLSHGAWRSFVAGDPGALGQYLRLDGVSYEIVGVLPPGFIGPMGEADVWFPLDLGPTLRDPIRARRSHWLGMVGRLAPDVTLDMAQRELAAIAHDLTREYPDAAAGFGVTTLSLRDSMVGDTRTPLLVLLASAGLVLVITCANLAGAFLSRLLSRRKEFALRVALGAGRGRLVRQLLAESMVLALAGGAAGILLAVLGLAALRGLGPTALPPYADLSLDRGAVLVTALLALGTGLLFGVAPALSAARWNPQGALRNDTRGNTESRRSRRFRGALVAGQIALCVSLLAGAGLLARSLRAMTSAPLGFHPDGLLTAVFDLPAREYSSAEAQTRFYTQLEQRLRALPGVSNVASASELPLPSMSRNGLTIQGVTWPEGEGQPFIAYASVSDEYFRTMGIPLRGGRTFGPADRAGAPPVIVISEGMARRYWPGGQALGARIRLGPDANAPWAEVIGIVGDVRNDPARPRPEPMTYASSRQDPSAGRTVLLRTAGDPLALVRSVKGELSALDPGLAIHDAATLRALLSDGLAGRRVPVVLLTAFGGLALFLASMGVYAMFANLAASREAEFGVRVALGSSRRAIAGLVLRQGAIWMAAGLIGGAVGMALVGRLLRGLLYGVAPFDPVTVAIAVGTLVACGTVALLVPVHRATRVNPVVILR